MVIIGFGHKMRSGKDTAVAAIIRERGSKFDIRRYAFADALKEEVAGREFELCMKHGVQYDPDNKNRKLLQFWGQMRRDQNPFYWVRKLVDKVNADKPDFVLIPDLRYFNETLAIRANKGYTVRCNRIGYPRLGPEHDHISENELNSVQFDFDIDVQDGDVAQLEADALELFDTIVAELDYTPHMEEILEGFRAHEEV